MAAQEPEVKQNGDVTPSTASRIKPTPVENAFPTPPRRDENQPPVSRPPGRMTPNPERILNFLKPNLPPQRHKSDAASSVDVEKHYSKALPVVTDVEKEWQRQDLSKKTSAYFEEAFAVRQPYNQAKQQILKDSVIVVEIRVNFALDDTQSFLADLLMTLSETYQRPSNNIAIVLDSEVQLMLGGSTGSAYVCTVSALASELGPMRNLRTVTIIQDFLNDTLHVAPNRGVVKFESVREENLATNGATVQQEVDKLGAKRVEEKRSVMSLSRASNRRARRSDAPRTSEDLNTVVASVRSHTPKVYKESDETDDSKASMASVTGRLMIKQRKSIMSFFRKPYASQASDV